MKLESRITRILKKPVWACLIVIGFLSVNPLRACIWDAETLAHEKSRSHDLAAAILGPAPAAEDPQVLRDRIKAAEANRKENDPDWWNNLAGAYMRLNQPDVAVKLLEPEVAKFPKDYGIHANLGTAYHLLGRYAEAEKEIALDLEINPDAHFGLEKYHLALLQYLSRSTNYQARHVYVDEFTSSLLETYMVTYSPPDDSFYQAPKYYSSPVDGNYSASDIPALKQFYLPDAPSTHRDEYVLSRVYRAMASLDSPQPYQAKWNLAQDKFLEDGVIYMAEMNPKEPACFEMLGMVAWKKRDYNLVVSAFKKAILLGSPQTDLLQLKIEGLQYHIDNSLSQKRTQSLVTAMGVAFFIVVLLFVCGLRICYERWRRKSALPK